MEKATNAHVLPFSAYSIICRVFEKWNVFMKQFFSAFLSFSLSYLPFTLEGFATAFVMMTEELLLIFTIDYI